MTSWTGGCHCGAIRYRSTADPIIGGHCHCTDCQSLSGSGHTTHVAFPAPALTIEGELSTYDHPADSGATITSGFCPQCGSPVTGKSSGMPGMLTVRVASLDDPSAYRPEMVVFARSAQPWDPIDPALPAHQGVPPMG
jgi:hypothetical protein